MYERIDKKDLTYNRREFQQISRSILSDLTIEGISITIPTTIQWKRFSPHQTYPASITYGTRELGTYTVPITIQTEKENGRWVFHWDWNYFGDGVTPQSTFIAQINHTDRGKIISSNGVILAEDKPTYAITLVTNAINTNEEESIFNTISKLHNPSTNDGISYFDVQNRFKLYSIPNKPVFLSTITKNPEDKETADILTTLKNFSGVTLLPTTYRWQKQLETTIIGQVDCDNFRSYNLYFYSSTICDGVSGLELQYNATLKGKNGGTLTVISPDGEKHILIEQQKKNGEDVIVNFFL